MKTNIILGCLLCFVYCPTSWACDYYFNPLAAYGWGYYYPPTAYSQEAVPYYALHPPVYYSHPIPRTYGGSPFPYMPETAAFLENSYVAQPKIIRNWHLDEAVSPNTKQYQALKPLQITNPYVKQSAAQTDTSNMSNGVKWEVTRTPKPLVVYPTSYASKKTNITY